MTAPINVLLITADQWRADCLSALGHPVLRTPHLDALAEDGVLFRNHFAQCSPCGPSRASLLTGMYLMNHRSVRNGTPLDARFTNVALEARKAGYDPSLIGYTDTSADPRLHDRNDPALSTYAGTLPGFKQLIPGSEGDTAWLQHLAAKGYDLPADRRQIYEPAGRTTKGRNHGATWAPARYKAEDSDTAFSIDGALRFIAQQKRPWFLHLSILHPHPPFIAPAPYNAMYDARKVPGFRRAATPEDEAKRHPHVAYIRRHHLQREGLDPERHPEDEAAMRQLRATYYGLMSEVDDQLGRLMSTLKKSGHYDDTLIVFTTDHGEQLWDHWLLGKETFFDQSFHIPLIVRAPGGRFDAGRGRIVEQLTESVDVMPTILDLLGRSAPVQCDGSSLKPFLLGHSPRRWRKEVFWELDFRDVVHGRPETELKIGLDECSLAVLRSHRFKYIHFTALPPLFFDLEADPDELRNLASDREHAPLLLAYAQTLLSHRMAHADRTLTGMQLTAKGLVERSRPLAGVAARSSHAR
jgi:arylsulfatase A-like enzyme